MDERTYQLFRYYQEALGFFKSPDTALWATKHHIKHFRGYTKADLAAVLAEVERQKTDTSPMVHLTQHQLEAMLSEFRTMQVPKELRA
ncbi:hypothetical protein [Mesorhizobium sp. M8A.F.Ca.ET.165.01.1.1]|uniref:hypothetical protein n=1 Tax=Mesorhizobium sp. M8A.F.Ca.ET.165.01.1.1 TaxID=2563960 RepID=UPI001093CAC5|nr:hypothetical protein [Mesorhizobium sp. M8A.F.Ca.ET.165.01.1.1]TGT42752.1 hypothetical protein EN808_12785 [Mesorhizobium sp. M8A.F.Ca.ET.165.01.1.1]